MEKKKYKPNKTNVNIFSLGLIVMFVFIILRLAHIIMWHWVWITAPFWGAIVLVMFISLIINIINDIKIWKQK